MPGAQPITDEPEFPEILSKRNLLVLDFGCERDRENFEAWLRDASRAEGGWPSFGTWMDMGLGRSAG